MPLMGQGFKAHCRDMGVAARSQCVRWVGLGVVLGVGLLAACGAVASTTTASPTSAVCGPSSARTLASDRTTRVYAVEESVPFVPGSSVRVRNVYGCSAGGAKSYLLGTADACQFQFVCVDHVRLEGPLVAYALMGCGVDTGWTTVDVRRLTDGKLLRVHGATTTAVFCQDVGSLVLKPDGAVAWIATGSWWVTHCYRPGVCAPAPGFGIRQVATLDKRGFKVLDSGRAIAPRSLTLRGSTISWRHGNAIRTATLH